MRTKVANASWTWGNIGFITTGTAGAFPASNPTDKLIDLAYSVRSAYRDLSVKRGWELVDASGDQAEVAKSVIALVEARLGRPTPS